MADPRPVLDPVDAAVRRAVDGAIRLVQVRGVATTLVLVASAADILIGNSDRGALEYTASWVAVGATLLITRLPVAAFALTMPGLFIGSSTVAPVIALYALARGRSGRTVRPAVLAAAALAMFIGFAGFVGPSQSIGSIIAQSLYAALFAGGPIALGSLARTRSALAERLEDLRRARELEQRQAASLAEEREHAAAQEAVGRERARIAREMHDAVAHQVSLVVVQAGAMQVATTDPIAKGFASTVRELCVATLQELREMVGVLRASGGKGNDAYPQPTLDDLNHLIRTSDLPVTADIELPPTLSAAQQRAVYRFTQEALTNVRKHAPGATVHLAAEVQDNAVQVTITNGPSDDPPMQLPTSGFGLIGLRERAELLGGSIDAAPNGGGFAITMTFPITH